MFFTPVEVLQELLLADIGRPGMDGSVTHLGGNWLSDQFFLLQIGFLTEFLFGKTKKPEGEAYPVFFLKKAYTLDQIHSFQIWLRWNHKGNNFLDVTPKDRQQKKKK